LIRFTEEALRGKQNSSFYAAKQREARAADVADKQALREPA
jgi:hypothetical protein